jgi:hypothetical protein
MPQRELAELSASVPKLFEQLSIGKTAGRPGLKQHLDMPEDRDLRALGHRSLFPREAWITSSR